MEIIWRPTALEDLEEIHGYISKDNPPAADRIKARIRTAVERLAPYPNLGRPGRVDETRELVVAGTSYIVAYAVLGNQLMVLSVIHGAQAWPDEF